MNLEHPYLRRCRLLGERGLSARLVADLKEAGKWDLLREWEALTNAELSKLNRLDRERRGA